eukprot:gene9026-2963_t
MAHQKEAAAAVQPAEEVNNKDTDSESEKTEDEDHRSVASDQEQRLVSIKGLEILTKGYATVNGPLEQLDDFLEKSAEYLDKEQIILLRSWYQGMSSNMVAIRDPQRFLDFARFVAGYPGKFSAHLTSWCFEALDVKEWMRVEIVVRRSHQKLEALKPYRAINEFLEDGGMLEHARVMHVKANGYFVDVPIKFKKAVLTTFCNQCDGAGLGMLWEGKFVRSSERQAQDKKDWAEKALQTFGAVGINSMYYPIIFPEVLAGLGIDPKGKQYRPQYNLERMGMMPYTIEGLTMEDKGKLASKPILVQQPEGQTTVRFGYLGNIIDMGKIREVLGQGYNVVIQEEEEVLARELREQKMAEEREAREAREARDADERDRKDRKEKDKRDKEERRDDSGEREADKDPKAGAKGGKQATQNAAEKGKKKASPQKPKGGGKN